MIIRGIEYFEEIVQRLNLVGNEQNIVFFDKNCGYNAHQFDIFLCKLSQRGTIEGKNNFFIKDDRHYKNLFFDSYNIKRSKFFNRNFSSTFLCEI